jgi:LacI family transcriptional regulator
VPSHATIREVARVAGVSTATVSATINQSKFVSPELQRRVREAVDQLGYRPNLLARSMKVAETKTIGLVFTNTTSPIWPLLVRTAQDVSQQRGYDTFLITTDEDSERERISLQSLLAKQVDGIIIAPAPAANYKHIERAGTDVPVVLLERPVPGMESVVTDNEQIANRAVSHLIEHGRRRIGLVTIPILGSNIAQRVAGYRDALDERGIYDPALIREADFFGRSAFDLAFDLLASTHVDALFATSQSTTIGAYRAARGRGARVPDDLALFGYDDAPWMEIVDCPLSVVRQPVEEIARLATTLLLDCIEDKCQLTGMTHMLPSSLVIRHSCGC